MHGLAADIPLSWVADSFSLPCIFAARPGKFCRMRQPYSSHSYPSSYYDEQLCLKPPLLLWVAVLFLSRAIVLPVVMAIGHFAGVDAGAISLFRGFWSLDALIPSLVAAAILYALCRRVPTASGPVRWIWAHGRVLLSVAAIADMVLLSTSLIRQQGIYDQSLFSVLAVVADVYFLIYILAARRVRHVFSEFPAPVVPR